MDAQDVIFESRSHAPSLSRLLRLPDPISIAAAAGFVAALIHAVVVREHLAHWWGYGAFFAGLALAQAVGAILIARRPGRRLFIAIAGGNAAVLALWGLSRILGTSFLGPHAGHPEAVGVIDLAAAAAELAQIIVIITLLRGEPSAARVFHLPRWTAAALIVVAAAGFAAPVGPVHADGTTDLLAIRSDVPTEIHEEQHLEELIPTPAPTIEEEPALEEPAPESCTPRLDDAQGVPPSKPHGEARAIVYLHQGALSLAAPPDGDPRRLTGRDECWESAGVFRDAETISFSADNTIYDIDLRSGKLQKILAVDGLSTFAWNDEGTTLAYLTWGGENSPPSLVTFTPATGATRTIRTFDGGGGRCGSMDDELSITWSSDGRTILLVATYLDFSNQTMFAVDMNGKDVIAPRMGTHALWGNAPATVIYREFSDARRWFSLDIESGRSTLLSMEPGTHHAVMSPDGRRIAYSGEAEKPSLFVYDLVTKTERVLTRGYAVPLWLSPNRLVATLTKACVEAECGGHGEWMTGNGTAVFDLSGTKIDELSVENTMDADILIEPATAAPSPAPSAAPPSSPPPSPAPQPSASPTSSPEPSPSSSPSPAAT